MGKTLYRDFDISFELDSTGDIKTVTNGDSLFQSIKINTTTPTGFYPGEGNEDFGVSIKHFLFTQVTAFSAEQIAETLIRQIEKYEPRVQLLNVNVENIDDKGYGIGIVYKSVTEPNDVKTFKTVLHTL